MSEDESAEQSFLIDKSGIRSASEARDKRPFPLRVKHWLTGQTPPPPMVAPGPVVPPKPGRIGIACSGGGIRSAAYNLGALQVLQRHGVLDRAQYLAAVSGGSYIAASIATVASRSDGDLGDVAAYAPGSPEEQHLRNNSSYLAPGWLSGKVRLFLRMLLGMTVNLVFLACIIYVVAAPYGWLLGSSSIYPALHIPNHFGAIHFGIASWLPVAILAGLWLLAGLPDLVFKGIKETTCAFLEAWSVRMLSLTLMVAFFVIGVPALLAFLRGQGPAATLQGAAHLAGMANHGAAAASSCGDSSKVAMAEGCTARATGLLQLINVGALAAAALGAFRAFLARRRSYVALFAGAVAGPLVVLSAFLWFTNEAAANGPRHIQWVFFGAAAIFLLVVGLFGDLTQWSLHPFYRRRLSSAFFVERAGATNVNALAYETLYPLSDLRPDAGGALPVDADAHPGRIPELLLCAAANISDEGATPPGRNAIPFVFSARELGGPIVGAMSTNEYEDLIGGRSRDITLPAAVAMSGAALAPTMGKKSIRALTFLLAMTNLRLGVWLPNPRWAGHLQPRMITHRVYPPPWYLLHELLGTHKLNHKYLYITDGGHYENLGLVELLRRGCTMIYCFDASGDRPETFTTLGEAIALARSEVEVDIDIDPAQLRPGGPDDPPAKDHVIGHFRYRTTCDEGTLVFCKTAVTDEAPWDVRAFQTKDKLFPNDSIFDQLFNDEKFEAYRALGAYTAEAALGSLNERLLEEKTREILIDLARTSCTISYADLLHRVLQVLPQESASLDLRPVLKSISQAEQDLGHPPLTALVEDNVELSSTELWEFAKLMSLRRVPRRGTLRRRQHHVYQYWAQNGTVSVPAPAGAVAPAGFAPGSPTTNGAGSSAT